MTDTKPKKLSPEEQTNLDRCLISAARDGDTETVQTLLTAGAHVHAQNDYALRRAAWNGHTETVKTLLAASADVHAVNDYALRWATENGRTETVKTLLAAGANVHARDDWALCLATRNGHTETVQVLQAALKTEDAQQLELERQRNPLYAGTGLMFAKSTPEDMEALLREAMAEQARMGSRPEPGSAYPTLSL